MPALMIAFLLLLSVLSPAAQEIPVARSHDNEAPAGQWSGNTLNVSLVMREARFFAEAADGPSVVVPTFGRSDGPPEVPGPLLRVTTGQSIQVTLRNDLAATASVHGFRSRGTPDTPIEIPAGETREITFVVNEPGLFLYWATTGQSASLEGRNGRDGLLNGLIRSDGPAEPVREQSIFVIQQMAGEGPPTLPEKRSAEMWLVNGKMWPFGQELEPPEGKPIVWRWINASYEQHPMHLHGSYFELLAKADQQRETQFRGADVSRVVTQTIQPGEGFLMRWQPPHPGNWLFHCHIVFHTGLRFINITPVRTREISLLRDGVLQQWKIIAKDGMDIPAARAKTEPAAIVFYPGETYDVEFTPSGVASLELVVKTPGRPVDKLAVRQSIVIGR